MGRSVPLHTGNIAVVLENGMFSRLGFSVALSVLCLSGITRKCLSGEATAKPQSGDERSHWAFRPVRGPVAPPVRDARWLHNPIDAFVLARLENAGIKPAAQKVLHEEKPRGLASVGACE